MRVPGTIIGIRKSRARNGDSSGPVRTRSSAPRAGGIAARVRPGSRRGLPGRVVATQAPSFRESSLDSQAWLPFPLRRTPADGARLQVGAWIAPAGLDPPKPQPAVTPRMTRVRRNGNLTDGNRRRRPCSAGLSREGSARQPCVTGGCHRVAGSTPDPACSRTRRPPGCPGNSAVSHASCRFPLPVDGANRFRASPGHAQLRRLCIWHGVCKGHPARAARNPKRPLGTSTCERSLRER